MDFLKINGEFGEGGGQIIRTAITLSCITKQPIIIENIRKNRKIPGLRPQHLTAIKILQKICNVNIFWHCHHFFSKLNLTVAIVGNLS